MDEESALAVIFANTKRRKRLVDLLTVAECFAFLKKIYPNQKAIAEKTDLSREMVREFLVILDLPDYVKELIRSRKIDSIDKAYRLSKIKDKETLRNAVDKLVVLQTHDIRDIVSSMHENSELSIETAKESVLATKPRDIHFFVIDFTEKDYKTLVSLSKHMGNSPAELVKKVVEEWLNKNTEGDSAQ